MTSPELIAKSYRKPWKNFEQFGESYWVWKKYWGVVASLKPFSKRSLEETYNLRRILRTSIGVLNERWRDLASLNVSGISTEESKALMGFQVLIKSEEVIRSRKQVLSSLKQVCKSVKDL